MARAVELPSQPVQQPTVRVLPLAEALEPQELVGRVGTLVFEAEREAGRVGTEMALEQAAHGNRSAGAHVIRLLSVDFDQYLAHRGEAGLVLGHQVRVGPERERYWSKSTER